MREGVRHGRRAIPMMAFSEEWPNGIRYCDRIKPLSAETTLGARPGLGNKTCYNIPTAQVLTLGKRGCSLDNGPKVNHSTAKYQIKQKNVKIYVMRVESDPQHYSS